MEEQGDQKTREIHKATQDDDDRSQPNHIPFDLTLEILSRLPAKSIMRYRCVSKLWSSFTTLPSFINSFTSRSTSRPPRLLLTFSILEKHFVFSFPQNQNQDGSYPPYYSYQITNPKYSDRACSMEPNLETVFNLTTTPRNHLG
ncbi:unnamed protein product [Eruca vesicaria subsp. sativa]|uniref:F-box domain-containing protein n=1 Tax=Eruca vesicaria subsp. sativa TaxID=29727 RepID=A0ABC8KA18_ERUVS|nr:unnamed protein product [Eruca vesicaria subsp. sativa]